MNYTEAEIDEILEEYSPWVRAKSRQFPSFPEDDLVQEALLAMWKELVKYEVGSKIPIDFLMKRRASWRMLDIVSGRPWTSYKDYKRHAGLRHTEIPLSPLVQTEGNRSIKDSPLEQASRYSLSVEIDDGYLYRQEIREVLAAELSPRQRRYAVLRYMYGFKNPELKKLAGNKPDGIEDKLREPLAHLKDLVH